MIDVKIEFVHSSQPYRLPDENANITASFPKGSLPNTGDIVRLDDIKFLGSSSYRVVDRVFEISNQRLYACTLVVASEKDELGLKELNKV